MPSNRNKKHNNPEEKTPYGPSWYDVYIILKELHTNFPDEKITVNLLLNTSVDKRAGLLVWVRNGMGTVLGAKPYMDSHHDSAKTAAAAFWVALTKAYHTLEEKRDAVTPTQQELDITGSEADPPFDPEVIGY